MKDKRNLNSRIMRYSLALQEYNFKVVYVKGEDNPADYLSRCYNVEKCESLDLNSNAINRILEEYHFYSGHGSFKTMTFLISQKYKWERMNTDILGYINNCKQCKKQGGKVTQTKNNIIYTTKPNECWQVDLIGP
ncbi:hypothetical protein COBT_004242, partial [Conglomerata obtusa]